MTDSPTSPLYYKFNFYHVPTDFEYVGVRTNLGHGWSIDNKTYTMRYYNDQHFNGTTIEDAINEIRATGSPSLKPLMSWNGDIALEYYPNRDSIFAATIYFKEFGGGFMPFVTNEEFVIGGQTVSVPVIQTTNSPDKSQLWGVEVTIANRFSWLPKPLDGFGGKVSYNKVDIAAGLWPYNGAAAPSGRLIQKISDQWQYCANRPPSTGPAMLEVAKTAAK